MAEEVATEPQILNKAMSEAFDWSEDDTPVRDAIWNYFMENNDHSTEKTLELIKPYIDATSDEPIREFVEANLKK
jgi:hypothetical protein